MEFECIHTESLDMEEIVANQKHKDKRKTWNGE